VILHIASGRARRVSPAMYIMTGVCILYFATII
jgi:xanthine/uracil/vitamin C permease (AzgA family)